MDTRAARKGGSLFAQATQLTAPLTYPSGLGVKNGLAFPQPLDYIIGVMKNNSFTTLALAASVRKPLPPPSRPFKSKNRPKRHDWKREVTRG